MHLFSRGSWINVCRIRPWLFFRCYFIKFLIFLSIAILTMQISTSSQANVLKTILAVICPCFEKSGYESIGNGSGIKVEAVTRLHIAINYLSGNIKSGSPLVRAEWCLSVYDLSSIDSASRSNRGSGHEKIE